MRLHRRRLCSRASVGSGAAGDVPRTIPVEGSRIRAVTFSEDVGGKEVLSIGWDVSVPAARPLVVPRDAAPRMVDSGQLVLCRTHMARSRPHTLQRMELLSRHDVVHMNCIVC